MQMPFVHDDHMIEKLSTSACSFRLLKRAGIHRRRVVASLSRCHIVKCILHGVAAQCETESFAGFGLPSAVN